MSFDSFEHFGIGFEEELGALLIYDFDFAKDIMPALNPGFFTLDYVRLMIEDVFQYYKEFDTVLGETEFIALIFKLCDTVSEGESEQIRDYMDRIDELNLNLNATFIKKKSFEFCKSQAVKISLLEVINDIEKGDYSQIIPKITEAVQVGDVQFLTPDYHEDFESRYGDDYRHYVPTGWAGIDELLNGGHGRGELGVIMAPPNIGKSMICDHLMGYAMATGHSALLFTLELGYKVVERRLDAYFTGIQINSLPYQQQQVLDALEMIPGQGLVLEFPTGAPTMDTLRATTERVIRTRFRPDVVVIDYPELMRYSLPGSKLSKADQLGELYVQLRNFAKVFNVALWVPSQVNRDAYKSMPGNENASESAIKMHIADLVIGFNYQYDDDGEPHDPEARITKNRNGPRGGIFSVEYDPATVTIELTPSQKKRKQKTAPLSVKSNPSYGRLQRILNSSWKP